MAAHSSILAWEIPWTQESGRLQSITLQRVGHDWATKSPPHQSSDPSEAYLSAYSKLLNSIFLLNPGFLVPGVALNMCSFK